MARGFANILTTDVATTAAFYEALLGMEQKFSADWFVNLVDPENPHLELGILQQDSEIVPAGARQAPAGIILTFVVDDTDRVHELAVSFGATILEPPKEMPYGQRRLLLQDPAGTIVDISSLVK